MALLVGIFCNKEQWSLAASGRLQRSPQQWVGKLLAKPSLCQLTFSSAALMWKGDGERSPLSPAKKKPQKPQMKGKGGIPKAASNRAGFHQSFCLPLFDKQVRHLNGSCSFFLRTRASWFFPLKPLHHFPLFPYSWKEKELIIYFSFWNPVCGLDFTSSKLPIMSFRAPDYFINTHFWKLDPQLNTVQKYLIY